MSACCVNPISTLSYISYPASPSQALGVGGVAGAYRFLVGVENHLVSLGGEAVTAGGVEDMAVYVADIVLFRPAGKVGIQVALVVKLLIKATP